MSSACLDKKYGDTISLPHLVTPILVTPLNMMMSRNVNWLECYLWFNSVVKCWTTSVFHTSRVRVKLKQCVHFSIKIT